MQLPSKRHSLTHSNNWIAAQHSAREPNSAYSACFSWLFWCEMLRTCVLVFVSLSFSEAHQREERREWASERAREDHFLKWLFTRAVDLAVPLIWCRIRTYALPLSERDPLFNFWFGQRFLWNIIPNQVLAQVLQHRLKLQVFFNEAQGLKIAAIFGWVLWNYEGIDLTSSIISAAISSSIVSKFSSKYLKRFSTLFHFWGNPASVTDRQEKIKFVPL